MEIAAPGSTVELAARLAGAVALGAVLGFDREVHQRPAGLRTHAMTALGAALLSLVALGLPAADPLVQAEMVSRVLQGVVVGVGFIGGGTILRQRSRGDVQGLTTATSVWVVAAVGAAAGLGLWAAASLAVALAFAILTVGRLVDRVIGRRLGDGEGEGPHDPPTA